MPAVKQLKPKMRGLTERKNLLSKVILEPFTPKRQTPIASEDETDLPLLTKRNSRQV
jgi:hypothetical protein